MNELKSKVTKWGIKLLTLGILTVVMCSVVNGQVEIERLKQAAQERREEARQEAKQNNLPTPAIVDADLVRPTLNISKFVGTSENVGIKDDRITMGISQLLSEAFQESAYTLMRYYEGNNPEDRYLLLRSPIIFMPTVSFDWKLGTAFTFNLGVSMGYNTVVNDYGERDKSFSILFGTYF